MNQRRNFRAMWLGAVVAIALITLPAAASEYREEFHKTYPVAANVQVSLTNVNGGVEVSSWDRNEVQVDAVKHADTKEKLDEMKIQVDATSNSVFIQTKLPRGRNYNPGHVEYQIHVPRTAKIDKIETVNGGVEISGIHGYVHASTVNGNVEGVALTGEIDLATVNGGVSCEAVDFANSPSVRLKSVNGGVELYMPRDGNAHLSATTVHGGISSDFSLPVNRGFVGATLDTTLGSGATRVDLSSVNGGISIHSGSKGI